jgi:hypothetical protein
MTFSPQSTPARPGRAVALLLPLAAILATLFTAVPPAVAGGSLTGYDFTGSEPGPVPGTLVVDLVPIRWDPRCPVIRFDLNTAAPPNPAGPDFLTFGEVADELQLALDSWNAIPTSYVEMEMAGTVNEPANTFGAFDFVNEVNFLPTGSFFAGAPSVSLTSDSVLTAGLDLDGDLDADVFDPAVEGIEVCADVDGDGDVEFPAGFYEAGTILDSDVFFNNLPTWTIDDGEIDADSQRVDLRAVAVHEFGHSHGLAHSLIDRLSSSDGTGATMFPFLDSGDPLAELEQRSLELDDVAWSSYLYPEGSAADGPAALGAGDVAFDELFGVVTGEVTHGGTGLPVVGGSVLAVHRDTGEVVGGNDTGKARYLFDPAAGLLVDPSLPSFHLVDGRFTLPLPAGEYHLAVEALDGAPVAPSNISRVALVGSFFGVLDFNEEFLLKKDPTEEFEPREIEVEEGETVAGVDHTTSVDLKLDPFDSAGSFFGDLDGIGVGPVGRVWAVRFPADELLGVLDQGLVFKSAAFRTFQLDASEVPVFAQASLVPGSVDGGSATLDLDHPIVRKVDFIAQENDFAPLYFKEPGDIAEDLREAIEDEGVDDFFLILELPDTEPGASGFLTAVGLDAGQEAGLLGRTFLSNDFGETFFQFNFFNLMFRLIAAPAADD